MIDSVVGKYILVLVVAALTGCGGSSASPPQSTATPLAVRLPQCAETGHRILLPAAFPRNFPLPAGSVIMSSRRSLGGTVITGAIPSQSFKGTAQYFLTQLPKRGYKVEDSETEAPHDAEGQFRGKGIVGRWALKAITGCGGAIHFEAFAEPLNKKGSS